MGLGFEVTADDVAIVIFRAGHQCSEKMASDLFDLLDCEAVEKAAMAAVDFDEQVELAHKEIVLQLIGEVLARYISEQGA